MTETSDETTARCRTWTTTLALDAVAWGRAPRHKGDRINRRVMCADGFAVSVQASDMHYANDSHPSGEAPYWSVVSDQRGIHWPFVTFELGGFNGPLPPALSQVAEDAGGVCPFTEREDVAALLDGHGGAVGFEGDA